MLVQIRQFFRSELQITGDNEDGSDHHQKLRLAAAALLIEVSRADYHLDPTERQAVLRALAQQFDLDATAVAQLVALAEAEVEDAISLYQFTGLVNENYSYQQKLELIESMWRVAFADGELDKYEDYLIRKVTDLIYVSHSDFIRCKLRVQPG